MLPFPLLAIYTSSISSFHTRPPPFSPFRLFSSPIGLGHGRIDLLLDVPVLANYPHAMARITFDPGAENFATN